MRSVLKNSPDETNDIDDLLGMYQNVNSRAGCGQDQKEIQGRKALPDKDQASESLTITSRDLLEMTAEETSQSAFSSSSSSGSSDSEEVPGESEVDDATDEKAQEVVNADTRNTSSINEMVRPGIVIPSLAQRFHRRQEGRDKKDPLYDPGCKGLTWKAVGPDSSVRVPKPRVPSPLASSQRPGKAVAALQTTGVVSPVEKSAEGLVSPVSPVSPLSPLSPVSPVSPLEDDEASGEMEAAKGVPSRNDMMAEWKAMAKDLAKKLDRKSSLGQDMSGSTQSKTPTNKRPVPIRRRGSLGEIPAGKILKFDLPSSSTRSSFSGPCSPLTPTLNPELQYARSVMANQGFSDYLKLKRVHCIDMAQKHGHEPAHLKEKDEPSVRLVLSQEVMVQLNERLQLTQTHLTETVAELERERERRRQNDNDIHLLQTSLESAEEELSFIRSKKRSVADQGSQSAVLPESIRNRREQLCNFLLDFAKDTVQRTEGGPGPSLPLPQLYDVVAASLTVRDVSAALTKLGVNHTYEALVESVIAAGFIDRERDCRALDSPLSGRLRSLEEEVSSLQVQKTALDKELEELRSSHAKEEARVQAEKGKLLIEVQISHEKLRKLNDDVTALEHRLDKVLHEKDRLKAKNTILEAALAKSNISLETKSRELAKRERKARQQKEELEAEVAKLRQQNEDYRQLASRKYVEERHETDFDERPMRDPSKPRRRRSRSKDRRREAKYQRMYEERMEALRLELERHARLRDERFERWWKLSGWLPSDQLRRNGQSLHMGSDHPRWDDD